MTLIVGIGTGRCGTLSLAKLLNLQSFCTVSHEMRPLLSWDSVSDDAVIARFMAMQKFASPTPFFGDVAFFNLNYIPVLMKAFPDMKVIYLTRPRQEVIASYLKVMHEWPKLNNVYPDHWTTDLKNRYVTDYDDCFPSYSAGSLEERIGKYVDEYGQIANNFIQQYPDSIYSTDMVTLFDTAPTIHQLFDWLGFPKDGRMVEYIREVNHNII